MKTAEQLYAAYVQRMADYGVGVDTWEELDATDHRAWEAVAAASIPKGLMVHRETSTAEIAAFLIEWAEAHGEAVRIFAVPRVPLAMRNQEMVFEVWPTDYRPVETHP